MSAAGRAVGGVLQYTADHQHGTGGAWPAGRAVPREDAAPGAQRAVIKATKGVRSQRGAGPRSPDLIAVCPQSQVTTPL